ncbi:hypothetical protein ACFL21_04275, partial [Patescibacteria group bacterium]
ISGWLDLTSAELQEKIRNNLISERVLQESQRQRQDPFGAFDWMDNLNGKFDDEKYLEELSNLLFLRNENIMRYNEKFNKWWGNDITEWFYGMDLYEYSLGWSGALAIMDQMSKKEDRENWPGFEFPEVNKVCSGSLSREVDDCSTDLSDIGKKIEDISSFEPETDNGIWEALWDYEMLNYLLRGKAIDISGHPFTTVVDTIYKYLEELDAFIAEALENKDYQKYVSLNIVRDSVAQAIYGMDVKYGYSLASLVFANQAESDKNTADFDMDEYTNDMKFILYGYVVGNENLLHVHNLIYPALDNPDLNVDQKIMTIKSVFEGEDFYQYYNELFQKTPVDAQAAKMYLNVLIEWMTQVGAGDNIVALLTRIQKDADVEIATGDLEEEKGDDPYEDFTSEIAQELDDYVKDNPEIQELHDQVSEILKSEELTSEEKVMKVMGMEGAFFDAMDKLGGDSEVYRDYVEILAVRWAKKIMPDIDI